MTLKMLRRKIDALDKGICEALAQRMRLMPLVAREKRKKKLPIKDVKRENEAIKERVWWSSKRGLKDSRFVTRLFTHIMAKSRKEQAKSLTRKR